VLYDATASAGPRGHRPHRTGAVCGLLGTGYDFTGKLVDVSPDGRAEILSDGILRARYRESLVAPVFMDPGHIYELHISLRATANVFKASLRIRLEVTSSNFPQFDRNSNTGGPIVTEGEKDLVPAINRIYHDWTHVSHLLLPIIERDQG
jgi:uncharacterized protein